MTSIRELSCDQRHLHVLWADGHHSAYDAIWLLDNRPEDRDPRNGQRLEDVADLPEDPGLEAVEAVMTETLKIRFDSGKTSLFDLTWLRQNCYCGHHVVPRRSVLGARYRSMLYREVLASPEGRHDWLHALAESGIAFLHDVPVTDGRVLEVASLVGYVIETNYGRVFDVRSVPNPNNLAYTGLGLGLHTDNPYRDPAPGLQLLHCMEASPEGGESIFADGFAIAQSLRENDPLAFQALTTTPVRFTFRDEHTELTALRPLIQMDANGEVEAIHYNNRSIAPLALPPEKMGPFYRAYRAFALLLRDPEFERRFQLGSGDLVAFDNRRFLHGRTAFDETAGTRRLQGCYVARDAMLSNLAVLERHAILLSK